MTDIDNSTETVRRLLALVVEHQLSDLEVEQDGVSIRIKGLSAAPAPAIAAPQNWAAPAAVSAPDSTPSAPPDSSTLVALESPMVGVFYWSPSPDDPPFVTIGDMVSVDQTIGVIEAMKTFNNVPAEKSGRIVKIAADNGKIVQQGQPLFFVEPM